jgi:hypothetical protein
MSKFKPWIGKNYHTNGLNGIKILFLGESHYGKAGNEKADTTINVIKRLALGEQRYHRFFTTIAKFALLKGAKNKISKKERKEFWESVAFYNYVQEFVGDKSRIRPTKEMWQSAKKPFCEILEELKPQLIVVLGKELNKNLPRIPTGIEVCRVNHPSSVFKYAKWIPKLQDSLEKLSQYNFKYRNIGNTDLIFYNKLRFKHYNTQPSHDAPPMHLYSARDVSERSH